MDALQKLIAKSEIRDLALLYARGVDRKNMELLRTLYTHDGWDSHGSHFDGPADQYIAFLAKSAPHMHTGAHHICNHLIDVTGDCANGEVYAIAWHLIPDGAGGLKHDFQSVRYIDNYRFEGGRWLFARRTVSFDIKLRLPADDHGPMPDPLNDPSYQLLASTLFARRETS